MTDLIPIFVGPRAVGGVDESSFDRHSGGSGRYLILLDLIDGSFNMFPRQ